jgi:hypothetical protein
MGEQFLDHVRSAWLEWFVLKMGLVGEFEADRTERPSSYRASKDIVLQNSKRCVYHL